MIQGNENMCSQSQDDEKERLKKELEDAKKELVSVKKELEEKSVSRFKASHEVVFTPKSDIE